MERLPLALLAVAFLSWRCFPANGDWPDDTAGCQEMGCSDRLDIAFTHRDGEAFSPGVYAFQFTPDGGDRIAFDCVLEAGVRFSCSGKGDGIEVVVEDAAREIHVIMLFAPPALDVEITFEKQLLASEVLAPDYTIFTPNGPECDPTCLQSAVVVRVSDGS